MPNKRPLLPDPPDFSRPPCPQCGALSILARIEPHSAPGRFLKTYECPACKHAFKTFEESDA